MIARKTKDRQAEASCLLVCGQMYAYQLRWSPAFRVVEQSRDMFEELGEVDNREQAEGYLNTLREAAQEHGYFEEQQQRGRFQHGNVARSGYNYGQRQEPERAGGIFQRKAFPWNPSQQ